MPMMWFFQAGGDGGFGAATGSRFEFEKRAFLPSSSSTPPQSKITSAPETAEITPRVRGKNRGPKMLAWFGFEMRAVARRGQHAIFPIQADLIAPRSTHEGVHLRVGCMPDAYAPLPVVIPAAVANCGAEIPSQSL